MATNHDKNGLFFVLGEKKEEEGEVVQAKYRNTEIQKYSTKTICFDRAESEMFFQIQFSFRLGRYGYGLARWRARELA